MHYPALPTVACVINFEEVYDDRGTLHDHDLHILGEAVFSVRDARREIVVTNVGLPRKVVTVEV